MVDLLRGTGAVARGLTDAFAQCYVDMLRVKEDDMDNVRRTAPPSSSDQLPSMGRGGAGNR